MRAIAYVSAAIPNLDGRKLDDIVAESRRLNALHGITGVLLHCDGSFMQYIEGDAQAVGETFARIRASSSHSRVYELLDQAIVEREFTDWTMGFAQSQRGEFAGIAGARWRDLAGEGPGLALLRTFWASSRCAEG